MEYVVTLGLAELLALDTYRVDGWRVAWIRFALALPRSARLMQTQPNVRLSQAGEKHRESVTGSNPLEYLLAQRRRWSRL